MKVSVKLLTLKLHNFSYIYIYKLQVPVPYFKHFIGQISDTILPPLNQPTKKKHNFNKVTSSNQPFFQGPFGKFPGGGTGSIPPYPPPVPILEPDGKGHSTQPASMQLSSHTKTAQVRPKDSPHPGFRRWDSHGKWKIFETYCWWQPEIPRLNLRK